MRNKAHRWFSVLSLLLVGVISSAAQAQPFEEGRHYVAINAMSATPSDKVLITEAFAYPCPACRAFLPVMHDWTENAPDYVEVERLPIVLRPGWEPFARAYYTVLVMDLGFEAHEAIFKALHDERRPIRSMEDIGVVVEPFGVDANAFVQTSQSFAVESMMGRNRTDVRRFGIRSTPNVIIQGKWRMDLNEFSSYQEMMRAVDMLVAREAELLGIETGAESSAP